MDAGARSASRATVARIEQPGPARYQWLVTRARLARHRLLQSLGHLLGSAATNRLTRTRHLSRTQTKDKFDRRVATRCDRRTHLRARYDRDTCFVGRVCGLRCGDVVTYLFTAHDSDRRRLCFAARARERRVVTAETQH